jgi:hypothetical protein
MLAVLTPNVKLITAILAAHFTAPLIILVT